MCPDVPRADSWYVCMWPYNMHFIILQNKILYKEYVMATHVPTPIDFIILDKALVW